MSSLKLHQHNHFDATIGRELKSWGRMQKASRNIRQSLMHQAARQQAASVPVKLPFLLKQHRRSFRPEGYSLELSRMLFSEAALFNVNIERRALRFVS